MNALEREEYFTQIYRDSSQETPCKREALLLAAQYPGNLDSIKPGDLLAGRESFRPFIGFHPEPLGGPGLGLYCKEDELREWMNEPERTEAEAHKAQTLLDFWKNRTVHSLIRSSFDQDMSEEWTSDDYINDDGASFPLYRLALVNLDFGRLMRRGLPGLREDILTRKSGAEEAWRFAELKGSSLSDFIEGLEGALDVLESVLSHFLDEARTLAGRLDLSAEQIDRAANLALCLESLLHNAPDSLQEALQLAWITAVCAGTWNWGRMDDWAGQFLVSDLNSGALSDTDARELILAFYDLTRERSNVFNNRIILGGLGRNNTEEADVFARFAMEVFDAHPGVEPQLTWRFHTESDSALHSLALDLISRGRSFPLIYNDDAIIPAVASAFSVDERDAVNYSPQGCGEYVLGYSGTGTPNGIINLTKCLEAVLAGGRSMMTERSLGPTHSSPENIQTFERLWEAYAEQVEYHVDLLARFQNLSLKTAGENSPFLLISLLSDNCLEKGLPLLSGGARRIGCSLEVYGEINAADSLSAIRKTVFDDETLTVAELAEVLTDNFSTPENQILRQKVLSAPKFGNDDAVADSMLSLVHNHSCRVIRESAARVSMDYHLAVIINNSVNSLWGLNTAASADGRSRGEALANGINPAPGQDKAGLPALLNSLLVPELGTHAGAVQNLKLSSDFFKEHRDVLESLLKGWFGQGGAQLMITVLNEKDLEDAYVHPEKWPNLIVRVGGFSARFVTLDRTVQKEILDRTLYGR
ncbi:MAG: pyruvate formate lyase family protein [Spirochaetales bacterium]|nr:pyruvate formate lyase family protein [Spirochaetales bacterium]